DDLMRIFGGERIKSLMDRLNMPEDQPIEAKIISRAIESAQAKVEGFNFDARKHILEYDDVMNKHREVFYKKRKEVLERAEKGNLREMVVEMIKRAGYSEENYKEREKEIGEENMRQLERIICLKTFDFFWMEHLEDMARLRDSVGLRAYGQKDPLVEYKKEGHRMFKQLMEMIDKTVADGLLKSKLRPIDNNISQNNQQPEKKVVFASGKKKVGRNDPCPCGSGKKYKKCCWPKYGY
ncbi:MAG TPA: preprotein translocase subunit SecA, partial [Candidatus Parcubacteria bacterium]|nr:preprotein translocase subunit SecA [Candidatus Parcubacteria bacterium]